MAHTDWHHGKIPPLWRWGREESFTPATWGSAAVQTRRSRRAAAAAAPREATPSLARIAETYLEALRRVRKSETAISLSERPSTRRRRTSTSRGVSPAATAD